MHEWFHLSAWFAISCLMHDRTTHGTLFNPFEHLQFRATSCTLRGALFHIVACILMHEWFHLGAWFAISCLMHDRTTCGTLFNPFEHLQFRTTSCTLRGALFHIVACILMHDRITYGTLFNPFGYSRFRATSCTLRGSVISYRSVHLDARKISPRLGMKCGGFCACFFVQQVARYRDVARWMLICGVGVVSWGR